MYIAFERVRCKTAPTEGSGKEEGAIREKFAIFQYV